MKLFLKIVYLFCDNVTEHYREAPASVQSIPNIVTLNRGARTFQLSLHPRRKAVEVFVVNPDNTTTRLAYLVGLESDESHSMTLDYAQQVVNAFEIFEEG